MVKMQSLSTPRTDANRRTARIHTEGDQIMCNDVVHAIKYMHVFANFRDCLSDRHTAVLMHSHPKVAFKSSHAPCTVRTRLA